MLLAKAKEWGIVVSIFLYLGCLLYVPHIGYDMGYVRGKKHGQLIDSQETHIVEAYSLKYSTMKNDKPYIIEETDKGVKIVAFPIRRKAKGYVTILAQSMGGRTLKIMPVEDFELTSKTYMEICAKVALSDDVAEFIASHIAESEEHNLYVLRQWYSISQELPTCL
jgi:hypothetical protein